MNLFPEVGQYLFLIVCLFALQNYLFENKVHTYR